MENLGESLEMAGLGKSLEREDARAERGKMRGQREGICKGGEMGDARAERWEMRGQRDGKIRG